MKTMIRINSIILLLFLSVGINQGIEAQNDCPNLKSPQRFDGTPWKGFIGEKQASTNGIVANTAVTLINDRCIITDTSRDGSGGYVIRFKNTNYPENWPPYRFRIFDITNSGTNPYDVNVPCYDLPIVPPGSGHTSSIRLGNTGGGHEGEKLTYEMTVDASNSLLTIYYNMVLEYIQDANHNDDRSPEFIIAIKDKTTNNPVSPCSRLRISSANARSNPNIWSICDNGNTACENDDGCIAYMAKWQKVVVNLNPYIGQTIVIEMSTGDCSFEAHYAYAWIAAECGKMEIQVENCATGGSDTVATVTVPSGLKGYTWSYGKITDPEATRPPVFPPTRQKAVLELTEQDFDEHSADGYKLELVCKLNSAMDPDPNAPACEEEVVAVVFNNKPRVGMSFDTLCNLRARFINKSNTKSNTIVIDQSKTKWTIEGVEYKQHDLVEHTFTSGGEKEVSLYIETTTGCSNTKIFKVHIMDEIILSIDMKDSYCMNDRAVFTANGANSYEWLIGGNTFTGKTVEIDLTPADIDIRLIGTINHCKDMIYKNINVDPYPILSHAGNTPICRGAPDPTLTVFSLVDIPGLQYKWIDSASASQINNSEASYKPDRPKISKTYYITATTPNGCKAYDTIHLHVMYAKLTADTTEICPDGQVHIIASDPYADDFFWRSNPVDATLTESGSSQLVRPSNVVGTISYSAQAIGPNGCLSTPADEIKVRVYPFPQTTILFNPDYIDSEEPTVIFTDESLYGVTSSWKFNDGYTNESRLFSRTFDTTLLTNLQFIALELTAYNKLGCPGALALDTIPIHLIEATYPNAFIPEGAAPNNIFNLRMVTNLSNYHFSEFHLYIYNRSGELVFETKDQTEGWNGKYKGRNCPSGSYIWLMKYKRPEKDRVYTKQGSVMLIR